MKKDLKAVENFLRNGKLPDKSSAKLQHEAWHKILNAQRQRRRSRRFLKLPPWTWALASIVLVLLCLIIIFLLK